MKRKMSKVSLIDMALSKEQEESRTKYLKKLIALDKRIKSVKVSINEDETRSHDKKYIGKLINRFQNKEWYYLPIYKRETLNEIWKRYKK